MLALVARVPEASAWPASVYRDLVLPEPIPASRTGMVRRAWVAERGADVLGLAVLQCLRTASQPGDAGWSMECEIETMLVAPKERRKGIAGKLMAVMLMTCKDEGPAALRLEVRESNAAAIALYQQSGFVVVGRRGRYYQHPDEDALRMELIC